MPVLGLGGLRISSDSSSDIESDLDRDPNSATDSDGSPLSNSQPSFPVEILPFLYLGCAKDSTNLDVLEEFGIKYILNVTPNLPNLFENAGEFKYKQIPISDHWSQNLSQFFPEAISFIDEARGKNCGVLVHCLAGISRSVTVTVAYLMQKLNLSMNDAYDIVKMKKSNISPNFNFMGQLLDFERTLGLSSPCDNRVPTQQLYFTTPPTRMSTRWTLCNPREGHPAGMCPADLEQFLLAASARLLSLYVAPGVNRTPAVCIRQGYHVWHWLFPRERFAPFLLEEQDLLYR